MKTISIGISTRNRPELLEIALKHFHRYMPFNYSVRMMVYDDFSDNEYFDRYFELAYKYPYISFYFSTPRVGIAKAKNECIRSLRRCSNYIFLFDDDVFPVKYGWADLYIDTAEKNGIHHMMHLEQRGILQKIGEKNGIEEYNNCAGCMLFITKEVVDKVGGFNKNFGIYGYEHVLYTDRIHRSGLNNGFGKYITPCFSGDFIYSVDLKLAPHSGLGIKDTTTIQPPLCNIPSSLLGSSMSDEEKNIYVSENIRHYNLNCDIYEEI
jgi:GT2 family glycosyltransferase